jgi:hypothetical protein
MMKKSPEAISKILSGSRTLIRDHEKDLLNGIPAQGRNDMLLYKRFLRPLLFTLSILTTTITLQAQNMGLSFSYFIPKNGYFSTPISPFSIRGIGVDINRYMALETGASLYRMSGLNVKDMPFESKDPIVGPNFTVFVPAELVIQFKNKKAEFDIKAGGFAFYGLGQKINYGNLDRSLKKYQGWDVANADVSFKNNPGYGYHFGAELIVYMTRQFGISIESNYLAGQSKLPMTGSYTGGTLNGPNQTLPIDFKDAKVDFTGFEFSIGVLFTGR